MDILEPLPIPSESWESLSIAEKMQLVQDAQRYEDDLSNVGFSQELIDKYNQEEIKEILEKLGHRLVARSSNLIENSEDRDDVQTRPAAEPSPDGLLDDEPQYPFVNFG